MYLQWNLSVQCNILIYVLQVRLHVVGGWFRQGEGDLVKVMIMVRAVKIMRMMMMMMTTLMVMMVMVMTMVMMVTAMMIMQGWA